MTSMQEIELERHHKALVKDVNHLVEKYRRMMDWDIPENDEPLSDRLIIQAIRKALDAVDARLQEEDAH
ncbi:MAG: hypothetical protein ACWA5X_01390 [bacterium]